MKMVRYLKPKKTIFSVCHPICVSKNVFFSQIKVSLTEKILVRPYSHPFFRKILNALYIIHAPFPKNSQSPVHYRRPLPVPYDPPITLLSGATTDLC